MRRWSPFSSGILPGNRINSPPNKDKATNFEATNYITKIKTALGNLSVVGGAEGAGRALSSEGGQKTLCSNSGIQRGAMFSKVVLTASYFDLVLVRLACIIFQFPCERHWFDLVDAGDHCDCQEHMQIGNYISMSCLQHPYHPRMAYLPTFG